MAREPTQADSPAMAPAPDGAGASHAGWMWTDGSCVPVSGNSSQRAGADTRRCEGAEPLDAATTVHEPPRHL